VAQQQFPDAHQRPPAGEVELPLEVSADIMPGG
jgi:hypothetical protein